MDAETLVRPVVEGAGFELVDVTFGGHGDRRILRITVDAQPTPDLDTLAALSDKVARRLDLEGFDAGRYQLEVSSPGLERPLKTPAHFVRFVGSEIRVKTIAPVDGERVHRGALVAATEADITLDIDGVHRSIGLADIASARTVVDWDAELRRSNA